MHALNEMFGIAALPQKAHDSLLPKPNLGWREAQDILALSAKQINDPNIEWKTNGAINWNGGGMHFSRDYGYGLVDTYIAVRLSYENL